MRQHDRHLDLAARPLWVQSLVLLDCDKDTARLEMICGKGGYVRSIARDLGRAMGCLGHVAHLRRTWSGPFDASDGVPFDRIDRNAQDWLDGQLLPLETALADLPMLRATPEVGWLVGIMAGWLGLIAGLVWMAAKAPRRAS